MYRVYRVGRVYGVWCLGFRLEGLRGAGISLDRTAFGDSSEAIPTKHCLVADVK